MSASRGTGVSQWQPAPPSRPATSYTDGSVTRTSYSYYVVAYDAAGNVSTASSTTSATRRPLPRLRTRRTTPIPGDLYVSASRCGGR